MAKHDHIAGIEELYREHGAALLLFAAAICGERSLAQDAVQQVFLRFLESGKLREIRDRKSYLFVSVRNAILNDNRIRQRNISLESEVSWFEPPARDHAAEESLRRALGALPEDQRQVTVLHIWGELTFAQIAEVLEISANTAASRYRYAIAKLREVMTKKESFHANF